jgi:hypothetical protein
MPATRPRQARIILATIGWISNSSAALKNRAAA